MAAAAPADQAAPVVQGLDAPEPSFEDLVSAFMADDEDDDAKASGDEPETEPEVEDDEPEAAADEDDDEPEAEPEPERKGKAKAKETDAGPQMLAEVAKEYDVPEDEFLSTIHLQGDDGTAVPMSRIVQEWRQGPQRLEDGLSRGRQELSQLRARHEQEGAKRLQRLDQLYQELEAVAKLEGEPNWAELEADDGEEYARQRVRWTKRNEALDKVRKAFADEGERYAGQEQEAIREFAGQQFAKLIEVRKDWRDPAKRKAAMQHVDRYLQSEGFTPEELGRPLDHRMVIVSWKAAEYDRLSQKARGVEGKRLRRLPKIVPAGSRREEGSGRGERRARKLENLRRTGSDAAATALLEELI